MAKSKVLGMTASGEAFSASPVTAAIWLAAAGVGALGFLVFSELYSWVVPVVLAVVAWAAAATVSTGWHRTSLALACIYVAALMFPMVGALAHFLAPFLSSIQTGEITFLSFVQTLIDLLCGGTVGLVCAVMALRSFPNEVAEKYFSYGTVSLPRLIIGSLILFGIAINFANVLGRYLFLAPIVWAEEIMIYSMVWMVFVGAVLVSWDGHHLRMDFFSIMMPSPFKEIMNFTGVVCFLLVCIFVLPQTFQVTSLMYRLDQRSVVAEIPMVIPHFAILLGFVLMFVAIVWRFGRLVKGDLSSEVEDLIAATERQQDVSLNRGASG